MGKEQKVVTRRKLAQGGRKAGKVRKNELLAPRGVEPRSRFRKWKEVRVPGAQSGGRGLRPEGQTEPKFRRALGECSLKQENIHTVAINALKYHADYTDENEIRK